MSFFSGIVAKCFACPLMIIYGGRKKQLMFAKKEVMGDNREGEMILF